MKKKGGETETNDMKNESNEAAAVIFTNYKRTDGFEVSFTLRGDSGSDLMGKFDKAIEAIKASGGTPLPFKSQGGGFAKPAPVTKSCPVHPEMMMTEKVSKKTGKPYFSHSRGTFPNSESCFGKGWPEAMQQESYQGDY